MADPERQEKKQKILPSHWVENPLTLLKFYDTVKETGVVHGIPGSEDDKQATLEIARRTIRKIGKVSCKLTKIPQKKKAHKMHSLQNTFILNKINIRVQATGP
jgi:hypothetical protein